MYQYRKASREERRQLLDERRSRAFPLHQTPHRSGENDLYLITAACFEHHHYLLDSQRRERFTTNLKLGLADVGAEMRAWVVLPNHYHLTVHVENLRQLTTVIGRIHGRSSHDWNEEEHSRGRRIWYRCSDRAIRSDAHFSATLNYVDFNPVKHGWVSSPYDWPDSSVHKFRELYGREWLQALWMDFPVHDYGKNWDDIDIHRDRSSSSSATPAGS
ncbi:MAG: REP-associated tyrosine transposase [Chloroflexota bacterium]